MPGEAITPRPPLTVVVANLHLRHIAVVSAVIAGIAIYMFTLAVTGEPSQRPGGIVMGVFFLLLACAPPLLRLLRFPPRRLTLDGSGLRWDDPRGRSWTVEWSELRQVTFSYPQPDAGPPRTNSRPPKRTSLDLRPADLSFLEAHPEMKDLAQRAPDVLGVAYVLPLGNAARFAGPIDDALASFAPEAYSRDGREIPRGLRRPWTVALSVLIFAVLCVGIGGTTLWSSSGGEATNVAGGAFWTAIAALWIARVWAGGPLAVGTMAGFGIAIGGLCLVMLCLLGGIGLADGNADSDELRLYGAALGAGAGLLLVGLLLTRARVRAWSEARALGR